jgi:hypothetical protein
LEVTGAAAIDQQCFVTASEEVAACFVADVVAFGVNAEEPFHSGDEIGLRGLEMKMVAHQAPGMDLPFGFGAGFAESGQEALAIVIVFEDVAALIATIEAFSGRAGLIGSILVHLRAGQTALSVQGQNTSRTAPVRFQKKRATSLNSVAGICSKMLQPG